MNEQNMKKIKVTEIRCPNCGAPTRFDIVQQRYLCSYCGGKVEIAEANKAAEGFRKIQRDRMNENVRSYRLGSAVCSGCGAKVIFPENEALSGCAFCGRSLVRKDYLDTAELPENVIPFAVTEEEARQRFLAWCDENRGKAEAKHLRKAIGKINGFYLPYDLIEGPVSMRVSRMDGGKKYFCAGTIKETFVNRSSQLDNLLLDGMEPYDTAALTDFDFAYLAGCRVKIPDLSDAELKKRTESEVSLTYRPAVRKILNTRAVETEADAGDALRIPVLLPAYYIHDGNLHAAVNGQTGKVSVRAEKESKYYFIPWWLKAILSTLLISALLLGALRLFGMTWNESLLITGLLAIVMITITLCLFSDTTHNDFAVAAGREIFTSGEKTFIREREGLVPREEILERKTDPPVFFMKLDGAERAVDLKFATPARLLKMILLAAGVLFLPVILALLINGFDFQRLNLGGSAAWFCLMVPVVPVYFLKFGIVELYDRPEIYLIGENGKKTRYRKKTEFKIDRELIGIILRAVFIPPVSLAVWFGIACFITMVYLTAFGF